ncbi:MAG: DUF2894 domain-containing protein [Aquabacterium sp.]|uniref:DUF2894 domain-containing protein n=1 Tax=Aquabacterium sp. TaxID=1872578 RepID=UPI0027273799|nr:DUF2894 domain-containing protein [Aquabacterium sp.]MDO9002407.1 DUF2894 domain-containing protein [Aquabacterium sp.]
MSQVPVPSLQAWRREGAGRVDPVRFHFLEVLSRRVDEASGELRCILQGKLDQALADYGQRIAQAPPVVRDERAQPLSSSAPLAQLNQYIQRRTKHVDGPGTEGHDDGGSEIKSARRFRETWSRIAAEKQVNEAFGRGPENAGPLNAHMLVLHSLRLMRDLSPHYLQQFMSQVDSLLWLDQVNHKYTLTDAKPVRQNRAKK